MCAVWCASRLHVSILRTPIARTPLKPRKYPMRLGSQNAFKKNVCWPGSTYAYCLPDIHHKRRNHRAKETGVYNGTVNFNPTTRTRLISRNKLSSVAHNSIPLGRRLFVDAEPIGQGVYGLHALQLEHPTDLLGRCGGRARGVGDASHHRA